MGRGSFAGGRAGGPARIFQWFRVVPVALVFLLALTGCTADKAAMRKDAPQLETRVVAGKEVRLEVYLYFIDIHTRHNKAVYEKRFSNGLKEMNFVRVIEGFGAHDFIRDYGDVSFVNRFYKSAEHGDAGAFSKFKRSGADYVVFFYGQLAGLGPGAGSHAECTIYLVDLRGNKVEKFSDKEYDTQNFDPVYRKVTTEFFNRVYGTFPGSYKKKVETAG